MSGSQLCPTVSATRSRMLSTVDSFEFLPAWFQAATFVADPVPDPQSE